MDIYKQLLAGLGPLGRRLRWRTGVELLTRGLWLVLLAAALVLLIARFIPLEGYQWYAAGIVGLAVVVWVGYSVLHRLTPFVVARRADAELGLRDRLATALALSAPPGRIPHALNPDLVRRQIDDALAHLRRIEARHAFPPRVDRRRVLAALVASAAIVALLVLPNPMDALIAEQREVTQTAQTEADKLEKLAEEVARNEALNPQDKEQLLQKMRELAAQLKANPGDAKEALSDLAEFQDQLRASLDLTRNSEAAALDALAQQIADLANATDAPRDASELAKLLEQLASNSDALSSEQRAALAQALDQTAAQVAATNPDLARALSQLAQSLNGNASRELLQQAASQATGALQNAAQQQALQQALAQALSQADSSQRQLAQASSQTSSNQTSNGQTSGGQGNQAQNQGQGQGQGQAQNQGQGQGQGQAQNQGQGQGQGQGQNQGQGQGQGNQVGGGGGTNADSLPPSRRTGSMGNPTGPNKSFNTQDIDTVYSPFSTGQGEQQTVSGQDTGNGQTTTRNDKSPLPGSINPARVPYTEVYQQYLDIAGQAMERSYIPSGLKDYVKEYFSALEP